ncbi:glucose transporter rco-like protein [Paramyrothecium foliicola]|nr:glucose transporter rco-like protein [Paramyrothecium foliicola]
MHAEDRYDDSHGSFKPGHQTQHSQNSSNMQGIYACGFAFLEGIFFDCGSGYANGSLSVSILSVGIFLIARIAEDVADWIGRERTVVAGCMIYMIGILMITNHEFALGPTVVRPLLPVPGVGRESAVVVLYMPETGSEHAFFSPILEFVGGSGGIYRPKTG